MTISNNYPTIRPTLLLDFANTEQLDPRITFSRPTTATYYNGVTTAKAEENLILQSQTFNTTWGASFATLTANSTVAPDGTTTAYTMTSASSSSFTTGIVQSGTSTATGLTYSIYAKAGTSNFVGIATNTSTAIYANFNVSTGAVASSAGCTASIVSVGNGWYRCIMANTTLAGNGFSTIVGKDADPAGNPWNVGTQASGNTIFIWGAQLEQRSTVTAYTATTTAPITNYVPVLLTAPANEARFQHNPVTGESLGLMIEEQRTNIVKYSSDLTDVLWTKSNATVNGNVTIAPDGTQTVQLITATTTAANVYQVTVGLAAGTYSMSVYLKRGTVASVTLGIVNVLDAISYNFDTGAIGGLAASTGVATNVGNGWIRLSFSYACSAGNFGPAIKILTAGGTVFVWGVQFELGAFATSYIPTTVSQVTRSADNASMTGTNFSSWYNQAEGALYADTKTNAYNLGGTSNIAVLDDSSFVNQYGLRYQNLSVFCGVFITVNNTFPAGGMPYTTTPANKVIGNYFGSSNIVSLNGAAAITNTGTYPSLNRFNRFTIGNNNGSSYLNGTIKKIAYYPARLTNTNLVALTGS